MHETRADYLAARMKGSHTQIEISLAQLDGTMLSAICFLILMLWLAGVVTGHTLGGLLHLLLLLAVIVLYIQYLERHRPS